MAARLAVTGFYAVCNLSVAYCLFKGIQLIAQHIVFAFQAASLSSEKFHPLTPLMRPCPRAGRIGTQCSYPGTAHRGYYGLLHR